jgi:hypothetical protein
MASWLIGLSCADGFRDSVQGLIVDDRCALKPPALQSPNNHDAIFSRHLAQNACPERYGIMVDRALL